MGSWQFYTPDGVSDMLPERCLEKRGIESGIREIFRLRGYREIETPGIEFYDVYAAGSGSVPQEGLFKFFDENGRILCLRYDGTVPTARMVATVCGSEPLPIRFFYIENMYRYNEYGGGRQREFAQAGIELMGSEGPEADAEVIGTAIETALACGLSDLQVSIGQVSFFRGIVAEWNLSNRSAEQLPGLISSRQRVAIEEMLDREAVDKKARDIILRMTSHDGSDRIIDELASEVTHPIARRALDNIRDILDFLDEQGYGSYVSVDLGLLQSLNYYTGTIFKGFTGGLGFPLFSGGRYDNLVGDFGRDLSATGFSMGIGLVMTALQRQGKTREKTNRPVWIAYHPGQRAQALALADHLRIAGRAACYDKTELSDEKLVAMRPVGPVVRIDADGTVCWLRKES
jgi:ATP phosphoribosyltransferase regulatory subunit